MQNLRIDRRFFLTGCASLGLASRAFALAPSTRPAMAAIDNQIKPGDDFYRYANGPWLDGNAIPADKGSWDEFSQLADLNSARTRDILNEAASRPRNEEERKLGQLFASLVNIDRRDAAGSEPVGQDLARIAQIKTVGDVSAALAALTRDALRDPQSSRYPGPIAALVYPDYRAPTRYLPTIAQGGLGLPDRDNYLADTPAAIALRETYQNTLARLFELAGFEDAAKRADEAYGVEVLIARAHRPFAETFDFDKRYNLWSVAEIRTRLPGLDWDVYLAEVGLGAATQILVADPEAIAAVAAAVRDLPASQWQSYLAGQLLLSFAPFGPRRFSDAHFAYAGTALKHASAPLPVWRQAVDTANLAMGPAIGTIYLERYFSPEAQATALALVDAVKAAMRQRLEALPWMSQPTKTRALAKLAAVRVEVGGESAPRDYSGLDIQPGAAWKNVTAAARHNFAMAIARLDRPLDRGIWDMLPQTVNAQSHPILNKIMFPAGIMQPPLFDGSADPAQNFGAIGMFIGHELSHLFDNIGALFDEEGRMSNWWQPADKDQFNAATSKLVRQYDAYQPFPDVNLKGRQMLHENVADLAGLSVALDAYRASLKGRPAPVIDGFIGEQRFFLSFAQLFREQIREPVFRQMIATGTHAHGEWRVATVRNMDAWYAAFDVKAGDRLYLKPEERVAIW